jgi:DNA-binding CsgD family transcriptional regulator
MSRLTNREAEVLSEIGRGLRGKRIAESLGISEFTVRKHRASIMRKLSLLTAAQLIAHAVKIAGGPSPRPGLFSAGIRSAATA